MASYSDGGGYHIPILIVPLYRCCCGNCIVMSTPEECVCCYEYPAIESKMKECGVEAESSQAKACITNHPGFSAVCLNKWVMQMSYNGYKQDHGIDLYREQTTIFK